MGYRRRVTLRCLCDDLTTGWGNVAQQRAFLSLRTLAGSGEPDSALALALDEVPTTALAHHPLVTSFFAAFESDDSGVFRESISGLVEPHWWKQKVSRWRGAATDAAVVGEGEVWLCAGGLRAAGEARDFYASFTESVAAHGPEPFLPSAEDRGLQSVEEKVARRDAWLAQVRLSALVCLHEASDSNEPRSLHVPAPAPADVSDPLMHLRLEILRVEDGADGLAELSLVLKDQDHSRPNLVSAALDAARSVIEPVYEAWNVLPGQGTEQIWATLISPELLGFALQAVEDGVLPPHLSDSMPTLGVIAHYTQRDHIVDATVAGDAVRGLCGTWFVPTANPDDLPVCPACAQAHARLPD